MEDECKWGVDDCLNLGEQCSLCNSECYYYKEPKKKVVRMKYAHSNGRMGSGFEATNHNDNVDIFTSQTPNSGAGSIKGDEQIDGYVKVMEELKTTTKKNLGKQPGKESFSIRKEWLEKVEREAIAESKEFWYVKFAFKDDDRNYYVVVDKDVIMAMINTMRVDRKIRREADASKKVTDKKLSYYELKNSELQARVDYLEAQIDQLKLELKHEKEKE